MKLKPQGANQTELTLADGTTVLFSYQTPVAAFVPGAGYVRTEEHFSPTTRKHISQWLARNSATRVAMRPQAFFESLTKGAV